MGCTTRTGDTAVGMSPRLDGPIDLEGFRAFSLDLCNPAPWRKRSRTVLVERGGCRGDRPRAREGRAEVHLRHRHRAGRRAEAIGPRDAGRFRALVLSLGRLGDPAAAATLAGMVDLRAPKPGRREVLAAVALYRCGDPTGAAKALLKRAAQNTDGIISRMVIQVLRSRRGRMPPRARGTDRGR